ncbi:MAG TPA: glycosyl hydrolase, partial [Armatimonadota bacterium]|nr:glycosyl hydrolase [Armatimonadota bacterium]
MSARITCIVATAVLCVWAAACQAQPEPRELALAGGNLEGEWRFHTDPAQTGERDGWASTNLDDSGWLILRVPGFWEDQGITESYEGMPSPELDPAVSKLNAYNGVAWYRMSFRIPAAWRGIDLVLRMGAVDDVDTTFVNGRQVGSTGEGAQNPSTIARRYDVPAECIDPDGVNTLAIRVVDHGGPGGMPQGPVSLLPVDYVERLIQSMKPTGAELRERFANPPADRRILKIVHGLPADPNQHETFFTTLLEQGFGGVVCNVSFSQYLQSDELWDSFVHGARLAHQLGMAMWLYDEEGYPSGNAGGLVLREHPEWQAKGLHIAETTTDGKAVELALPPGPVRLAVACPVEAGQIDAEDPTDLSGSITEGTLRWSPPAGEWHVFVFVENVLHEGTHAVSNVFRAQPYINIMDPRPVKRFIELTHEEYVKRLPELKDLFVATFTDEPSLMSGFMKEQPWAAVPWADDFAQTFRTAKGYDITPWLPALVADAGPDGHRARCDFWDHVGQRTADAFFGQIQDWCHQAGIRSGGHLLWEESIANHCIFYGDFYRCAERLDYPGIDCLTSSPPNVPWHIAKLLSSVAHLHGAPIVMSETSDFAQVYRPAGDTRPVEPVGVPDIVGTCNRLYVAGVNTTTSYYSWRDLETAQMRHVNEFVGRCGTMLTGGKPVTDVAVLYPIESVWAHMTPATQGATRSPDVHRIDRLWQECQGLLFRNQRDFEVIPSHAIAMTNIKLPRVVR